MKPSSFTATVALLAALTSASPLVAANPQDLLPPAPPWHGASEALIAKPDHPWITPAEKLQLLDTPNYDDTVAYLKKLCAASPLLSLQEFGRTAQGRPLYLVVATKARAPTPDALLATGKPTLLAQAGIHSGEIDGKDAGLMLLRDLAFGGKDALLDGANFLFIPIFNADGHERASEWTRPNQRGPVHMGWRTTAQNLNLNRDFTKADAPETRAWLALLNRWQPSLFVDLHVTDGIDYQYDVTFGFNGDGDSFAWSPHIAGWLRDQFRPAVTAALSAAGHIPGPLVFALDDRNLAAGLAAGVGDPRFATGYGDLRHLPSVIVENHSLKPYPQRVLGTYVFLEAALRTLAQHAKDLRTDIVLDRAGRPQSIPANWGNGHGNESRADFLGIAYETYDSPASGRQEVRWTGQPKTYRALPVIGDRPGVTLTRPKAYWVPVTKPDVIDRLSLHGVQFDTLPAPKTVEVELYRLVDPKFASEPFEGRFPVKVTVRRETHTETFPTGSVRVSTDQPLGDLVVVLLEPESADSFLAWGFFPEIFQRTEYIEGYVIAPLAEKMLAANPDMQAEFAKKLAMDPKFAADPSARLAWFYAKTKFYDDRYLLYPVGIER